jgi:hypothetical protein
MRSTDSTTLFGSAEGGNMYPLGYVLFMGTVAGLIAAARFLVEGL